MSRLSLYGRNQDRLRSQDGAVAVEFALILPVLVMLMFGVITAAMTFSDSLALKNAVREASRFGATTLDPDPAVDADWAQAVVSRAQSVYFNSSRPLQTSQVCAALVKHSGAASPDGSDTLIDFTSGCDPHATLGPGPDTPAGVLDGECVVKVWAMKPGEISLLVVGSYEIDLYSHAVSLYERAC